MLRRHTSNTHTADRATTSVRSSCKSPSMFAFLKRGTSRRKFDESDQNIHRASSPPCQEQVVSPADSTESTSELDILRSKSYESQLQPTMESTQRDSSPQNQELELLVPPPESVSLMFSGGKSVCSELSLDDHVGPKEDNVELEHVILEEDLLLEEEDDCRSIPFVKRPAFVPPEYVIIHHGDCFPLEL